MAEKKTVYIGTGRRKTSVARVRITDGKGKIEINGRGLPDYFTEDKDRAAVMGPLLITELSNRVDVIVRVQGGGAERFPKNQNPLPTARKGVDGFDLNRTA